MYPFMMLGLDWLLPSSLLRVDLRLQKATTSSTLSVASFRYR